MPTYTIRNKKTQEKFDVFMTWAELQEMLKEDPDLIQQLTTPGFVQAAKAYVFFYDIVFGIRLLLCRHKTIKRQSLLGHTCHE